VLAARLAGVAPLWLDVIAISLLPLAWTMKLGWWRATDAAEPALTAAAATGLNGTVRPLEPAHTGPSYVTQEMVFKVGRKHAARLRNLALNLGCWAAWTLVVLTAIVGTGWLATGLAGLAALAVLAGLLIERWLFFAEATHAVALYYGAERA
jgi:DMSO reductase anchor subunit